ncbi:MAG: hypothetical protein ACRD1P_07330 [Thermoanaerobaculia bacterium]
MSYGEAKMVRTALRAVQERTGWLAEAVKRHAKRGWVDQAEADRVLEALEDVEAAYMAAAVEADEVLG